LLAPSVRPPLGRPGTKQASVPSDHEVALQDTDDLERRELEWLRVSAEPAAAYTARIAVAESAGEPRHVRVLSRVGFPVCDQVVTPVDLGRNRALEQTAAAVSIPGGSRRTVAAAAAGPDRSAPQEVPATRMTSGAVVEFLSLMEISSVEVCLDGGWGIDALLGEQTREHGDLDIIVRVEDVPRLVAVTRSAGYVRQTGGTDGNFVLKTPSGHEVDVHAIAFDGHGFGVFALRDGRKWPFPPAAFRGRGQVQGREVRCLSPDAQVQCHAQGYVPDEADLRDMQRLQDRFGVVLPLALCRQP
jgi:lincosamide nucleotidyltransferase A/C/D/E